MFSVLIIHTNTTLQKQIYGINIYSSDSEYSDRDHLICFGIKNKIHSKSNNKLIYTK